MPLIPPFDFRATFVEPWAFDAVGSIYIVLMGFFVAAACGLIGNYLILRRMALVGDAISHSILPGLVIAFLFSGSLRVGAMFLGAVGAGIAATLLIEMIHTKSRVKTDAAIGIAFCSLFALGVVLVNLFAGRVHLDAECVLYGEIGLIAQEPPVMLFDSLSIGPAPLVQMGGVFLGVALLILLFYKPLLVSSFDPTLAASLGFSPKIIHYTLMAALSVVVVSAFESVGAILVIAMLILPGATAQLLTTRLPRAHAIAVGCAALSSLGGFHLGTWLDCSMAGAMVVAAAFLFCLAWAFGPEGLLQRWRRNRSASVEPAPAAAAEA